MAIEKGAREGKGKEKEAEGSAGNNGLVEEVKKNFYRIEVPLPGSPLKAINSYVVIGEERNLIIDTGMNRPECYQALSSGLAELNLDMERTDFFITHVHADHMGLVSEVSTEKSQVYFNKPDMELLRTDIWDRMGDFAVKSGFPLEEMRGALENHPGNRYSPSRQVEFTLLQEGDFLEAGGYRLTCLETPGHTPGSICLYEPREKLLLTGDHVLGDITPNISLWVEGYNPLGWYLESLDKVSRLDVSLVLPGHRRLFRDLPGRIQELKEHHQQRLEEIKAILKEDEMDAYQLASLMNWDIEASSWVEFPVIQRWFATGEAMAHLKYLEVRGEVEALVTQDEGGGEKLKFRLS